MSKLPFQKKKENFQSTGKGKVSKKGKNSLIKEAESF